VRFTSIGLDSRPNLLTDLNLSRKRLDFILITKIPTYCRVISIVYLYHMDITVCHSPALEWRLLLLSVCSLHWLKPLIWSKQ